MKRLLFLLLFFAASSAQADRITRAGVTIIREGVVNSRFGTTIETLKVYLPSGLNVATAPFSRRSRPCAVFENVVAPAGADLPVTLNITRQNLDPNAAAGPIYPLPDRIPVRFEAASITWTSATGSFEFNTTEELQYRDELQMLALQVGINRNLPGARPAASNGLYYLACQNGPSSYEFRAKKDGAVSFHAVEIALDPFKFGNLNGLEFQTHFPEMRVGWKTTADSQIIFSNDTINRSASGLAGADPSLITYARGTDPKGCEGVDLPKIPTDEILCGPDSSRWRFTRDGGLHAECTLLQDFGFTGARLQWMGYFKGGDLFFGHEITTRFPTGNLMTGGIHINPELLNLAPFKRLAALTHSGHSLFDLAPGTERPGFTSYRDGEADYPGLNFRCDDQEYEAIGRIADEEVDPYPLESASKYYLRRAGLSGLHLSSSNDPIEITALGGAEFELTALRLSFLDGENKFSGVDGSMTIPFPSDFTVAFEQLMFGPQGQLESATIAPDQGDLILSQWTLEFTPLALDFPQPKTCDPPPDPGDAFPRLTSRAVLAGLTTDALVGPIGFFQGNILAEADAITEGHHPISRFATSSNLFVNGPENSKYEVSPTSGISINKHQNGNWQGTISTGALIDLPFFVDPPVVATASSVNVGIIPDPIVRKPWADLDEEEGFDLNHRGLPPGTTFSEYRDEVEHDLEVVRDWQDLITFAFDVRLEADGYFRSRSPIPEDLFLFTFAQAVKSISPENAELVFDGNFDVSFDNLIPQVNIASLLEDSSLLDLGGGVDAVRDLDTLLADTSGDLLKPAIAEIVDGIITQNVLNQLRNAPSPADAQTILESRIAQIEGEIPGLLNGSWKDEILTKLGQIKGNLETLKGVIDTGAEIAQLANQLVSAINTGSVEDLPEGSELEETLAPVIALIDQVISQIEEIESALNGAALQNLLGAQLNAAANEVADVIDELDTEWTNSLVLANASVDDLQNDFTCAVSEAIGGTAFAGSLGQIMRQYLGDPRDLARQAIDDGIRKLETLTNDAIGAGVGQAAKEGLKDFMAGGSLRGYARINGDSLQEIRIDGSTELAVSRDQKMKFDAWFLFRSLDSSSPGVTDDEESECLKAAGVKAEIAMGAEADISWGTFELGIAAAAKVYLGEDSKPIGFTADFALRGEFDIGPIALQELKLGVGAGAGNGYFYGAASGEISLMSISAGIFVGLTCDPKVLEYADEDIGAVLAEQNIQTPVAGLIAYAEGGMSLMPIIGITPSCFLDVRVHGGQGFIALYSDPLDPDLPIQIIAGVKMLQGVSGELLCIVNVRGDFVTVIIGSATIQGTKIQFESLSGSATAKLKGKIGIGIFSFTFKATARLIITLQDGSLDWKFDF